MKINNLEVEFIGMYKNYRVYSPTGEAFLGSILYLGHDGDYKLCDPFTYSDVMHYLVDHHYLENEDDEE